MVRICVIERGDRFASSVIDGLNEVFKSVSRGFCDLKLEGPVEGVDVVEICRWGRFTDFAFFKDTILADFSFFFVS